MDHSIRVHWLTLPVFLAAVLASAMAQGQDDPKDWPTYNRDVLGHRQ